MHPWLQIVKIVKMRLRRLAQPRGLRVDQIVSQKTTMGTKACFSSFPACLVLIISMILQPIWPRQLSNAQGKRTAYPAASTVPKCMYQNQEAKYMDLIHLVEARGHHEAQQCNEVPNKIKL